MNNLTNDEIKQRLIGEIQEGTNRVDQEILSRIEGGFICPYCKIKQEFKGGCLECGGILDVGAKKLISSVDKQANKAINLLVQDKRKADIFGTYIYKASYYPGDIDIQEVIPGCCDINAVALKMKKILVETVKKVQRHKGYYISEIKAGLDHRFLLGIEDKDFIYKLRNLYNQKLLTKDEFDGMIYFYNMRKNKDIYDDLKEKIRQLYVIRWSPKDILNGYKILRGGKKETLLNALKDVTSVKIDMWAPINGKYVEVTNFFMLVVIDKKGHDYLHNVVGSLYGKELRNEIQKYASKLFYKPFKMVKRMWAYARYMENQYYMKALLPLLQSNIGRLNQIASEMDLLENMLKTIKNPPLSFIQNQIDSFRPRLSFIYNFDFGEKEVDKILKEISSTKSIKKIIEGLKYLHDKFQKIVNEQTEKYLKSRNISNLTYFFIKPEEEENIKRHKILFENHGNLGEDLEGGKGTKKGAEKNKYIQHLKKHGRKVAYKKGEDIIPQAPPLTIEDLPLPKNIMKEIESLPAKQINKINDELNQILPEVKNMLPSNINIYCGSHGPQIMQDSNISRPVMNEINKISKEIMTLPKKEFKKVEKALDQVVIKHSDKIEKEEKKVGKLKDKFSSDFINELNRAIEAGRQK